MSQNYTGFRMEQPAAGTWDEVARMCPAEPEWCCLFPSDCPEKGLKKAVAKDWTSIRPQ